ncbi:MAG TPA: glycosyltransferase [Isosphaeraceae bacterium]
MAEEATGRVPSWLFFADDWGRHPSSCQHLARRLLGRHRVLWVNTIGMRPPRLNAATLARGLEKVRQWAGRDRHPGADPAESAPAPTVINPKMWPWFRSPLDRRLNRRLLLGQLGPRVAALPGPPVAVTTLPIVADLVGRLPAARWIYYCVDDFGQWPGLDQGPLRRMEAELVRRADVVIAVSEALRARLAGLGRDAHLLTHGVDLGHWAAAGDGPPMPALDALPRPRSLFWGVIDRRMDPACLERLAAEIPGGSIVLVGPESDPDPALSRIPGVVRLPPVPYAELPGVARRADVLIMPYADLPVTRAIQPLKLKEYLATGRPVVARDLPAIRAWADCLDLADSAEAFARAVRLRWREGLPVHQEAARARLGAEGWDSKARDFRRWCLGEEAL